jgi:hypothetical protein
MAREIERHAKSKGASRSVFMRKSKKRRHFAVKLVWFLLGGGDSVFGVRPDPGVTGDGRR